MKRVLHVCLFCFAFLSAGCAAELTTPERFLLLEGDAGVCDPPAFVEQRCGSSICHDADGPAGGLDLVSPDAASRLVGVAAACDGHVLVSPGDIDGSFLFRKAADRAPSCGSRMPLGGRPLSTAELACLALFVEGLPQ